MWANRYNKAEIEQFASDVKRDGFCILPAHFDQGKMLLWQREFTPLLQSFIENRGVNENRGKNRYYVTLPFEKPFADESIFADADILAIVENLVGEDFVMCQLATDTPLPGSEYQDIHRDAPPLFPESGQETPAFQLAVNFPLVEVTKKNGAFEVARGTHLLNREKSLKLVESDELKLESILMQPGDIMIRDVRGLHRGTPNLTSEPRPMCVIGYSRRWLFRPEVSIKIPRRIWENLSPVSQKMLRYNPIVESLEAAEKNEIYQSFSF